MTRRVNYVIACWMGPRSYEDPRQVNDRSFFLRTHLKRLRELDHGVDQVTIVMATGGDSEAESYVRTLTEAEGAPFIVLARENYGYSYASWNYSYEMCGDSFSHYVFVEDDYMPCRDGFVDVLLEAADRKATYVCSLAGREGTHAAISNAIVSSSILKKVLPAPTGPTGHIAQTEWSKYFSVCGYPVEDWTDTHSSPFWAGTKVRWYGHPDLPPMFLPIQSVGAPIEIIDGRLTSIVAGITPDGRVQPCSERDVTSWSRLSKTDSADDRWIFEDPEQGRF